MDFMVAITAAVRRGAPDVFLVADMPFLSYQVGTAEAVKNAGRFMCEAGVQMVKIEATSAYLDVIKAVSDADIAVMAHIGIRPQSISKTGRFKAEATTAEMAAELMSLAEQMISSGAGSLLLEGTAEEVAQIITSRCDVPVISCGSGPGCDGQVLMDRVRSSPRATTAWPSARLKHSTHTPKRWRMANIPTPSTVTT
jgi:3-methyl-2-oxobutanoate hydroxymethyltransferase